MNLNIKHMDAPTYKYKVISRSLNEFPDFVWEPYLNAMIAEGWHLDQLVVINTHRTVFIFKSLNI
jgi:hypothetical protein